MSFVLKWILFTLTVLGFVHLSQQTDCGRFKCPKSSFFEAEKSFCCHTLYYYCCDATEYLNFGSDKSYFGIQNNDHEDENDVFFTSEERSAVYKGLSSLVGIAITVFITVLVVIVVCCCCCWCCLTRTRRTEGRVINQQQNQQQPTQSQPNYQSQQPAYNPNATDNHNQNQYPLNDAPPAYPGYESSAPYQQSAPPTRNAH